METCTSKKEFDYVQHYENLPTILNMYLCINLLTVFYARIWITRKTFIRQRIQTLRCAQTVGFVTARKSIPETGCDTMSTASDDVISDIVTDPFFYKFKERFITNDLHKASVSEWMCVCVRAREFQLFIFTLPLLHQ